MNIRYQADADLNQAIVTGVLRREPTIDFQTAFVGKLEGLKDPEVLALSTQQGRILVSHDRRTMPSEFAEFITSNQSSGVINVSMAPNPAEGSPERIVSLNFVMCIEILRLFAVLLSLLLVETALILANLVFLKPLVAVFELFGRPRGAVAYHPPAPLGATQVGGNPNL